MVQSVRKRFAERHGATALEVGYMRNRYGVGHGAEGRAAEDLYLPQGDTPGSRLRLALRMACSEAGRYFS